jgi:hypothetical protein
MALAEMQLPGQVQSSRVYGLPSTESPRYRLVSRIATGNTVGVFDRSSDSTIATLGDDDITLAGPTAKLPSRPTIRTFPLLGAVALVLVMASGLALAGRVLRHRVVAAPVSYGGAAPLLSSSASVVISALPDLTFSAVQEPAPVMPSSEPPMAAALREDLKAPARMPRRSSHSLTHLHDRDGNVAGRFSEPSQKSTADDFDLPLGSDWRGPARTRPRSALWTIDRQDPYGL